jgi:hypothetical protein
MKPAAPTPASEPQPQSHPSHRRPSGRSLRDRVVISVTIIGVALFLVAGAIFVKRPTPINEPDDQPTKERATPIETSTSDRDRNAVRDWFRQHTDDPRPQELRWWPARDLVELHQKQLEALRQYADADPRYDSLLDQMEQSHPDRVCRMRFRTTTQDGNSVTRDELFVIRRGKAELLLKNTSAERSARQYFPDNEGRTVENR